MVDRPVICGVDGSEGSMRALLWSGAAARVVGAELLVVHVRPEGERVTAAPEPIFLPPPVTSPESDSVIERARKRLSAAERSQSVRFATREGDPAAVLGAMGRQARFLVVGPTCRGRVSRLLRGSTGKVCATHADCPVVVAPTSPSALTDVPKRIVLGLDPWQTSDPVMEFAFEQAARRGCEIEVLTANRNHFSSTVPAPRPAGPRTLVEDRSRRAGSVKAAQRTRLAPFVARYPDVPVVQVTSVSEVVGSLVDAAASARLLVVGRQQRHRPMGALSPVVSAVLAQANCPVAVVPGSGATP